VVDGVAGLRPAASGGVLHAVPEEILEHLLEPGGIGTHPTNLVGKRQGRVGRADRLPSLLDDAGHRG